VITDFVLTLDGVAPFGRFSQSDWQKDIAAAGTEAYFRRREELKQERTYFSAGPGVRDADIASVRDQLVAQMRQLAGGQFQKTGVVCLFGSSNGAAVALALAAALKNELTINYICLADLPIFAGGRKPPIPGVGALPPSDPILIRTARSLISSSIVNADGDRPTVTLEPDNNAKVKENYYQHSGNGIKSSMSSGKWFWTSDMKHGEVHGVINNSGWDNKEITGLTIEHPKLRAAFGGVGDAFHQGLDDHVAAKVWPKRWPAELAKI
jgi:hypothetical protein